MLGTCMPVYVYLRGLLNALKRKFRANIARSRLARTIDRAGMQPVQKSVHGT
jgi:hypothetical protein